MAARWGHPVIFVVPEALVGRQRRRLSIRRRLKPDGQVAYPEEQVKRILRHLELPYRQAVEAVVHLGLRRKEVMGLGTAHETVDKTG